VRDVTERVALERELAEANARLRESRAYMQALLEHAPMSISVRDPEGRLVLSNRPAMELLPAQVEAVDGLMPPDSHAAAGDPPITVDEPPVRDGTTPVTFERTAPHPDGADHNYLVTKYPVTDAQGQIIAVGEIALDITQRRQAEHAVSQLATIVKVTDDGVSSNTLDGEITSWNPAAERIYGYTAAEAVGANLSFLLPPGREDEIPRLLARLRQGEHIVAFETVRRRKDGVDIDVSLTLSPIRDQHDAVVGASTVGRDVTVRRTRRERLRTSEALFRATVDYAPVGIAIIGPDGRWLRVNRMMCDITGHAEVELLGKTISELTHRDDLKADLDQQRRLWAGELSIYEGEMRFLRADGKWFWGLMSVSPMRDEAGAPVHFVCQIQDITERRRREGELHHMAHHDALSGLANRRTFSEQVDRHLAEQVRQGGQLALLMIDLDDFKQINDTFGHGVGDQVICAAAETLRDHVREGDIAARLGGDEFAVLLPHTSRRGAETVATHLGDALATLRAGTTAHEMHVRASIGVVATDHTDRLDQEALLAAGDRAMYQAKAAGGGGYALHDPEGGRPERATRWARAAAAHPLDGQPTTSVLPAMRASSRLAQGSAATVAKRIGPLPPNPASFSPRGAVP
jgi:diguanylate cyclase (GGDEF)-like protein/PAS domain S-box-containing protein